MTRAQLAATGALAVVAWFVLFVAVGFLARVAWACISLGWWPS
jgi:hypothetical protein